MKEWVPKSLKRAICMSEDVVKNSFPRMHCGWDGSPHCAWNFLFYFPTCTHWMIDFPSKEVYFAPVTFPEGTLCSYNFNFLNFNVELNAHLPCENSYKHSWMFSSLPKRQGSFEPRGRHSWETKHPSLGGSGLRAGTMPESLFSPRCPPRTDDR